MVSIRHNASHWRTYIACGGLGLAFFLAIFIYDPPAHAQSAAKTHSHSESRQNGPQKPFWQQTESDPTAIFTLILAFCTGVLAFASLLQIRYLVKAERIANKTAEAALETAKATQTQAIHLKASIDHAQTSAIAAAKQADLASRGFILLHRPRLRIRRIYTNEIAPNEKIVITIELSNIGDTNATIINMGADIFFSGTKFSVDPENGNFAPIPPGYQADFGIVITRKYSIDQIKSVLYDGVPMKLIGYIHYSDDIGVIRMTSFSRVFNVALGRFVNVAPEDTQSDREYEN